MKSLLLPLLFLASAVASPQEGRQDSFARQYGWSWAIAGQWGGASKTWEGGDVRGVVSPGGPDKRLVRTGIEPVSTTLSGPWEASAVGWIRAALGSKTAAREITIVGLKRDGTPDRGQRLQGCELTEIVFPALDSGQSGVMAEIALKFQPSSVEDLSPGPAIAGGGAGRPDACTTAHFDLAIDGLTCTAVSKIGAIQVRRAGDAPEVANIVLTLNEGDGYLDWKAWYESFVVQGVNGNDREKNGTLTFRNVARAAVLTLNLKRLGIVRMSRVDRASGANPGSIVRHEIELYCEEIEIPAAGAASNPPATPESGKTPASPPATEKPAAEGNPEDKGARDPNGVPRFPGSVRTAFTASRNRTTNEEYATYATKSAPGKVETWFNEQMKTLGWKEGTRYEAGDPKNQTYLLEVRWDGDKKAAHLTLGQAKDGSATILMKIVTRME